MKKIAWISLLSCSAIIGTACLSASPVQANEFNISDLNANPFEDPALAGDGMDQVTNVNQLRDVSPGDWAYEALRNLVETYGCIAGYPDGTYRGNRAMTRYEFAAGLNACLQQIERLIAASTADFVTKDDLATLQRLMEEFEAELATLGTRVDNLEGRVAFLEDNQFSTTTKLKGQVIFALADAFGDDDDTQTVFQDRGRLNLLTTFTGKDALHTRLQFGNIGTSFAGALGTNEGRFAYDGDTGNNVRLNRLHYVFPITDKVRATVMANAGGHHFYSPTLNFGLEAGGGGTGALSRFGERNPIFRQTLGGQGLGLQFKLSDSLLLSGGYLGASSSDPSDGAGLFNGSYSALGQLTWSPSDALQVAFTYVHGYDTADTSRAFNFRGVGTNLGNLSSAALIGAGADGDEANQVVTNSYGAQASFKLTPGIILGGWVGYTDAILLGEGDATIWNFAATLRFPDLFKEGNYGAIIVGAEPWLEELDLADNTSFENDLPLHIEALYKYKVSNNITVTPGVILLTAPNQDNDNDTIVIGTLRTVFSF